MIKMGPREILNKLKWHPSKKFEDYEIIILHRGAPKDIKVIPTKLVTNLRKSFFHYKENEEEIMIPYHRILKILNIKNKKVVWVKRGL